MSLPHEKQDSSPEFIMLLQTWCSGRAFSCDGRYRRPADYFATNNATLSVILYFVECIQGVIVHPYCETHETGLGRDGIQDGK